MKLEWEIAKAKSLENENLNLKIEIDETNKELVEMKSAIVTLKHEREDKIMKFLFKEKNKEKVANKI